MSHYPERYDIRHSIGKGGFAEVFLATDRKLKTDVAIKRISKRQMNHSRSGMDRVRREIEIHQNLDHPNIVKLFGSFEDREYVYAVLEYCRDGDLRNYLKSHGPFDEKEAVDVFRQVVEAVKHIHTKKVIHRDISTGNVFFTRLSPPRVKVGDLGLAAVIRSPTDKHHTMVGTPNFMSPEVVLQQAHDHTTDVWSLGALLYALLSGRPPFGDGHGQSPTDTLRHIVAGRADQSSVAAAHISPDARDLIFGMMNSSQHKRLSLDEVLRHPFLQQRLAPLRASARSATPSYDSGRGSMKSSAVSAPSGSRRDLDRLPPAPRPRCSASDRGRFLPPLPNGRLLARSADRRASPSSAEARRPPPPPLRAAEERAAVRERRREPAERLAASRSPPRKQPTAGERLRSPPPPCTHSRWDEERRCCGCGRRRSPSVERRPSGVDAASTCGSLREHGACRGSCRPPARDSRRDSGSRQRQKENVEPRPSVALPPLCTDRLKPLVELTKKAIFRILSDGVVCVEFISDGNVAEVMRISKNGQKIVVYRPAEETRVDESKPLAFNLNSGTHFNRLADLDTRYHKKYDFAYKLVQLVRAQTVKLTYYDDGAKCLLMESGAFEVQFQNGKSAKQKQEDGSIETEIRLTDAERSTFAKHRLRFLQLREDCVSMGHALSVFDGGERCPFPAVLGRRAATSRPVAPPASRPPPPSAQSSVVARASSVTRQPLVDANRQSSLPSSSAAQRSASFRKLDGGKMEIALDGGERLTLSKDGRLSYRAADGRCQEYTMAERDRLPSRVRRLLESLIAFAATRSVDTR